MAPVCREKRSDKSWPSDVLSCRQWLSQIRIKADRAQSSTRVPERELSFNLKRTTCQPSHLTAFKCRRKGKPKLASPFGLPERQRTRQLGTSQPPASLPDLKLQPQERDLPKTDSKGNTLLSQPLGQWTLPASLSVLSTCVVSFKVTSSPKVQALAP